MEVPDVAPAKEEDELVWLPLRPGEVEGKHQPQCEFQGFVFSCNRTNGDETSVYFCPHRPRKKCKPVLKVRDGKVVSKTGGKHTCGTKRMARRRVRDLLAWKLLQREFGSEGVATELPVVKLGKHLNTVHDRRLKETLGKNSALRQLQRARAKNGKYFKAPNNKDFDWDAEVCEATISGVKEKLIMFDSGRTGMPAGWRDMEKGELKRAVAEQQRIIIVSYRGGLTRIITNMHRDPLPNILDHIDDLVAALLIK